MQENVVRKISDCRVASFLKGVCISMLLYADDILLVAPSVTSLQRLLLVCEQELMWLEMSLNVKKSCCIRIGARYNAKCRNIVNSEGRELSWANEVRYQLRYSFRRPALLSVHWIMRSDPSIVLLILSSGELVEC